jgi:hypothetical protein
MIKYPAIHSNGFPKKRVAYLYTKSMLINWYMINTTRSVAGILRFTYACLFFGWMLKIERYSPNFALSIARLFVLPADLFLAPIKDASAVRARYYVFASGQ